MGGNKGKGEAREMRRMGDWAGGEMERSKAHKRKKWRKDRTEKKERGKGGEMRGEKCYKKREGAGTLGGATEKNKGFTDGRSRSFSCLLRISAVLNSLVVEHSFRPNFFTSLGRGCDPAAVFACRAYVPAEGRHCLDFQAVRCA